MNLHRLYDRRDLPPSRHRSERCCNPTAPQNVNRRADVKFDRPAPAQIGQTLGEKSEAFGREAEPLEECPVEHEDSRKIGVRRKRRVIVAERFGSDPHFFG